MKRRPGLAALFWRYLLTTGAVMALLAVLWWGALTWLMRCGFVYPASTAANGLEVVVPALENGSLAPEQLPYYYRWAVFDEGGELLCSGPMSERRLEYARQALTGDLSPKGVFYAQYHKVARLPDGTDCVLQYDYSMPYGTAGLQRRMPEFQTCASLLLVAAWLVAGAATTRHFAGLLRRDAALLTDAARTITDPAGPALRRPRPHAGVRRDPAGDGDPACQPCRIAERAVGHGTAAQPGTGRPDP